MESIAFFLNFHFFLYRFIDNTFTNVVYLYLLPLQLRGEPEPPDFRNYRRRSSVPHIWDEASISANPKLSNPPSRINTPLEDLIAASKVATVNSKYETWLCLMVKC